MLKKIVTLAVLSLSLQVYAFSGGSGTCVIDANYASITAMTDRFKNFNHGTYTVTSNVTEYIPGQVVELTLAGPIFTGLMFTVVDENGINVGTFAPEANFVHECTGANPTSPPAAAVTHLSSFGNLTTYTLFWIPPAQSVGTVYVLGYVLKGERFNTAQQEFFRFVRDDNSALSIISGILFSSGFE